MREGGRTRVHNSLPTRIAVDASAAFSAGHASMCPIAFVDERPLSPRRAKKQRRLSHLV